MEMFRRHRDHHQQELKMKRLMNELTIQEQKVIEKLDAGYVLHGNTKTNTPFGLIDRSYSGPMTAFPLIPADIVRRLHKGGYLQPEPVPGRVMVYRKTD